MNKEFESKTSGAPVYTFTALHRQLEIIERADEHETTGNLFKGYGILGLTFQSGHILALRRYTISAIGPAFTAIWHRDPSGTWTIYSDTEPEYASGKLFGTEVHYTVKTSIHITWSSPYIMHVKMPERNFEWIVYLSKTSRSRMVSTVIQNLPPAIWEKKAVLQAVGRLAGIITDAGKINLTGKTSNNLAYQVYPHNILMVKKSFAVMNGNDFGKAGPLDEQASLGDFLIPQKGIFVTGEVHIEAFDESRHFTATSMFDEGDEFSKNKKQGLLDQYLHELNEKSRRKDIA